METRLIKATLKQLGLESYWAGFPGLLLTHLCHHLLLRLCYHLAVLHHSLLIVPNLMKEATNAVSNNDGFRREMYGGRLTAQLRGTSAAVELESERKTQDSNVRPSFPYARNAGTFMHRFLQCIIVSLIRCK